MLATASYAAGVNALNLARDIQEVVVIVLHQLSPEGSAKVLVTFAECVGLYRMGVAISFCFCRV